MTYNVFHHDTNSNKIVLRSITIRIKQYINNLKLSPDIIMAVKPLIVACFCFENRSQTIQLNWEISIE